MTVTVKRGGRGRPLPECSPLPVLSADISKSNKSPSLPAIMQCPVHSAASNGGRLGSLQLNALQQCSLHTNCVQSNNKLYANFKSSRLVKMPQLKFTEPFSGCFYSLPCLRYVLENKGQWKKADSEPNNPDVNITLVLSRCTRTCSTKRKKKGLLEIHFV